VRLFRPYQPSSQDRFYIGRWKKGNSFFSLGRDEVILRNWQQGIIYQFFSSISSAAEAEAGEVMAGDRRSKAHTTDSPRLSIHSPLLNQRSRQIPRTEINISFLRREVMKNSHRKTKRTLLAILVLAVIAANQTWGADYAATDLTPGGFSDSQAYGISGTQQAGYGHGSATGEQNHALLWNGSASSYVDLNPTGSTYSAAWGNNGAYQVGQVGIVGAKAAMWSGTADSYVNLHPASGYTSSKAYGVSGTQQVGSAMAGGYSHAMIWSGSASSYVDLNPSASGFNDSHGYSTNGTQQVGYGRATTTSPYRALLWSGTAASCVNLNPSGYDNSEAYGISGTQQVGIGWGITTGGNYHAMTWNGSAASYTDLNPSGITKSLAFGTNGTQQVGYGSGSVTGNNNHALLWNGSSNSFIDLHQFLPTGFTLSCAQYIDSNGNIVGAATDSLGYQHAILWEVPEPVTLLLFGIAGLFIRNKK
jgi:hypothetical protein